MKNKILQGDCLEVLKTIPAESVNMCMTSPPYWALRDYGTANWVGGDKNCDHIIPSDYTAGNKQKTNKGSARTYKNVCKKCGAKREDKQIGLEPTFEEHISKMCDVFGEVKRVLRKDGTCWVNYGDTYNAGRTGGWAGGKKGISKPENAPDQSGVNAKGIPAKSLTMIPFRFAIEMVNRGWILRNVIIWHKPNPMPSSAKDRFTVDFEYLFFFSKSKRYYFEQQFEPHLESSKKRYPLGKKHRQPHKLYGDARKVGHSHKTGGLNTYFDEKGIELNPEGRNTRTVWKIPTYPFPEAHFAVYPEKLCRIPIRAGCPEFICKKCGKARERIIEKGKLIRNQSPESHGSKTPEGKSRGSKYINKKDGSNMMAYDGKYIPGMAYEKIEKGLTDCGCNAGFRKGIVLDPFMGAGTTAVVARKLGRNYIGIELSSEYIKIAEKRLSQQVLI